MSWLLIRWQLWSQETFLYLLLNKYLINVESSQELVYLLEHKYFNVQSSKKLIGTYVNPLSTVCVFKFLPCLREIISLKIKFKIRVQSIHKNPYIRLKAMIQVNVLPVIYQHGKFSSLKCNVSQTILLSFRLIYKFSCD